NAWQTLAEYRSTSSGAWSRPGFDLTADADQMVQLGFYFESHDDGNPFVNDISAGWYVDEVTVVTGAVQTLVANVPESFEGGIGDWAVDSGTWEVGKPTSGP